MSSDDLAIAVRGLGKRYTIAHGQRPTTLREAIVEGVGRRFRGSNGHTEGRWESFWALRDVGFELKCGEVLGLIGRNGAGKSTLLKILARVTEPTTGEIDIFGQVVGLLEVGTGFHPELTGRENIFLNGAVLGMRRRQILRQFDAIVAFAGVEKFLDTPVKHYSSGMYMRLAFAVAAHLDPEILIVDEVLAVGDADFQRKCFSKIDEVSRHHGRTVILVSHSMASIEALCDRAIYLDRGQLVREGPAREIVAHYLATALPQTVETTPLAERVDRTGNGKIRFTSFHLEEACGTRIAHAASGRDIALVFGFESRCPGVHSHVDVGLSVHTRHEATLFVFYSSYAGKTLRVDRSSGSFRCTIPRLPLPPGKYQVGARITVDGEEADWPRDGVGTLLVEAGDFYGSGRPGCEGNVSFLVDGSWDVR
jgi:lipopolysaccharide transport system ATP-binding protein